MVKNFLSKILARDLNGLNIISTYCEDSTTSVSEIKYLKKNKIFLLSLTRKSLKDNKKSDILSVCKFEFIENVVAKNIDQKESKLKLKLMGIDPMKIGKQFSKQPKYIADKIRKYRNEWKIDNKIKHSNYTKPNLRKRLFEEIKATKTYGTKAGQWSARKAQLLAKKYKALGGGYY